MSVSEVAMHRWCCNLVSLASGVSVALLSLSLCLHRSSMVTTGHTCSMKETGRTIITHGGTNVLHMVRLARLAEPAMPATTYRGRTIRTNSTLSTLVWGSLTLSQLLSLFMWYSVLDFNWSTPYGYVEDLILIASVHMPVSAFCFECEIVASSSVIFAGCMLCLVV